MECIGSFCVDAGKLYLYWIGSGVVLFVLEFIVPGIFIGFLGIGAVLTGMLLWIFPFSLTTQIVLWTILSLLSILVGGHFVKKLFISTKIKKSLDEIEDYNGKIVLVTKNVKVNQKGGWVKFSGTDWRAMSLHEEIPIGSYSKIVSKNNLTFLVEEATKEEIENYLNSQKKSDDYN